MNAVAAPAVAPGFSERISSLLERVDYRLMESDADREEVFRLRYKAYTREGAIVPNLAKKFSDSFDDADNSWTIGLYIDGEIASSMRICISSPQNPLTPAVQAFPDLLESKVERGKIIMDSNRFVADPDLARIYAGLPYLSIRLAYLGGIYFEADLVTATARHEHQAFYKRNFGLEPLCDPRPYPTLTKPLSLMMADCASVRKKILARYPYFHSTHFERRMLFERYVPPRTATMLKSKLPSANLNDIPLADETAVLRR